MDGVDGPEFLIEATERKVSKLTQDELGLSFAAFF